MVCSVIIATFNRSNALEKTLRCFGEISVPAGWDVELIVADNGSTDDTPAVVRNAKLKNFDVRYIYEGRKGKSNALNSALQQSRGEIILFTDDDVSPANNWIESMGRPLLERQCDGAVGRIELAKELCRPWMTETHKGGLAAFDGPGDEPVMFIGANVGIHRSVLEHVPAFDPELGPGALGLWEDTLFSLQLTQAKLRLRYIPEAWVIHNPDPNRLIRRNCLSSARTYGAGKAYVLHHWHHEKVVLPGLRCLYVGLKRAVRLAIQRPPPLDAEGVSPWESSYVGEMAQYRQFIIESRRPRNYSQHGLRKQSPQAIRKLA